MQLPALAVSSGNDLGRTLATVAQLKNAGLKNRLLESRIAKEGQLSDLRSRIMGGGQDPSAALEAGGGPTNAAAAALETQGGDVDEDLLKKWVAAGGDPGLIDSINKLEARELDQAKRRNASIAKLLIPVMDAPPEQQPMAYAQALAQAQQQGLPVGNAPKQWNPQWGQAQIAQAMTLDQIFEQKEKQKTKKSDLVKVMTPKGPQFVKAEDAVGAKPYEKPSALDEKTNALIATGVPENIARGITAGRYKTDRHPINGTLQVVDMSSGEVVYRGDQQAGPAAPAGTPDTPANVPADTDMAQGTGSSGFFGNLGNTIADAVGADLPAPQAERAAQALTNLKVRTQTAMQASVPGRPSNYLMEQLGKLSVEPNSLFQGDQRSAERLRQTRDMLAEEIQRMDRDILGQPEGFSPKQIAETRANRSQLQGLLNNYDAALKNFNDDGGSTLAPDDEALINKYLGGDIITGESGTSTIDGGARGDPIFRGAQETRRGNAALDHVASRGHAARDVPPQQRTPEQWQDIKNFLAAFGAPESVWEREEGLLQQRGR